MKKLKHQYKQSIQSTRHDYLWKVYPNVRSSIFSPFFSIFSLHPRIKISFNSSLIFDLLQLFNFSKTRIPADCFSLLFPTLESF